MLAKNLKAQRFLQHASEWKIGKLRLMIVCIALVVIPFLLVRSAYSQEVDDCAGLTTAQVDSLVWTGEQLERELVREKNLHVFHTDSLSAVNRHITWERDMAKKEGAGVLSDPRLWFTVGLIAGITVTGMTLQIIY